MKAESESQRPKGRVGTVSALNAAIEAANLAEKVSSIAPAKVVFGFVRVCFLLLCNNLPQVHTQPNRTQR